MKTTSNNIKEWHLEFIKKHGRKPTLKDMQNDKDMADRIDSL